MGTSDDSVSEKMYRSHLNDPNYRGEPTGSHLGNGPLESRSCTDILCCVLFLGCWVGSIFIALYSFSKGKPAEVFTPVDSSGTNCGLNNYTEYNYLYYPAISNLSISTCVKSCPLKDGTPVDCKTNKAVPNCSKVAVPYNTTRYFGIICLPPVNEYPLVNSTMSIIEKNFWASDLEDLNTSKYLLIGAPFLALGVAFAWIFLLRWCVGALTWILIALYFVSLGGGGTWLFVRANDTNAAKSSISPTTMKILAYVLWIIGGVSLVMLLCWFKKVSLGVAVLKCASQFVEGIPSVLVVPPIFFALTICFMIYWTFVVVYLWSVGDLSVSAGNPFKSVNRDGITSLFLVFHVWIGFWNFFYLIALPQFVIASCCCYWYFAGGNTEEVHAPLRKSLLRGFILHAGSIAFGAAILAVISVIKLLFDYLHTKLKEVTVGEAASGFMRGVFCCVQCCLDCFERFIKFINKHAYVQIAMTGESFCKASEEAFFLAARNVVRLGIVHGLGGLFSLVGEVFISASTAFFAYVILTKTEYYKTNIVTPAVPTLLIAVISFIIGSNFMSVYGTAADTIIHLFCMDEEAHNHCAKHAPELLREFIHQHANEGLLRS